MVLAQEVSMATSAMSNLTNDKNGAGRSNSIATSTRPASSHTLDSTFADSAVDMEATTPTETLSQHIKMEANSFEPTSPTASPPADQTLLEKLRGLTAVAWTLEQDSSLTAERRDHLRFILKDLETHLGSAPGRERHAVHTTPSVNETGTDTALQTANVPSTDHGSDKQEVEEDEWIDESELITVRSELAATVQSMKMRQEEQRHLHRLTIHKLEAVAQRCLAQEQQAEDLLHEIRELRLENHNLGHENEQLRERLACTKEEAAHKEVAVHAMSSAVAGLEGWIESTHASRPQTPVVEKKLKRQRVVIRGKGRFRGRYYVDEDGDHAVAYSLADAAAESQELHDGVKAWLRGFRDVEEELRQHDSSTRARPQGRFRRHEDHRDEDDWGDFQSPDSYR